MLRFLTRSIAVGLLLLAGCNQTKFEAVPADQVDQAQKAAAEAFTQTVWTAWNESKSAEVNALLSEEMQAGFTSVDQEGYARKNNELFGKFVSMTYVETQRTVPPEYVVYRFKGKWEKKEGWEIRVVYDTTGKVGGFWAKPWKDSM